MSAIKLLTITSPMTRMPMVLANMAAVEFSQELNISMSVAANTVIIIVL